MFSIGNEITLDNSDKHIVIAIKNLYGKTYCLLMNTDHHMQMRLCFVESLEDKLTITMVDEKNEPNIENIMLALDESSKQFLKEHGVDLDDIKLEG